jgi:hypothetical protein
MIGFDDVLGWIAIGVAASLAGMIWPFRRGTVGVLLNVGVAVFGAVAVALASYAFLPPVHEGPLRLLCAAVGAIGALLLAHALWNRRVRDANRPGTPSQRSA